MKCNFNTLYQGTHVLTVLVVDGREEKRHSNSEEPVPFELKLNITNSEIVFVEDTSQWDSNAVILKVRLNIKSFLKQHCIINFNRGYTLQLKHNIIFSKGSVLSGQV